MHYRRVVPLIALLLAALILPAMRQDVTLDELDLRTINNKTHIAQLELELAALRAELKDLRENCCADTPPVPEASKVHSPASIPAHNNGVYYFRLTAITELEKIASLLEQAVALEETAQEYREQATKRQSLGGKKLSQTEIRQLHRDASDYDADAKKLRREYNNPGFALAGFDADGRDVTCNVTGPDMRAAAKIPHNSIVMARGDVIENTDDRLTLNSARVGRVRE